MKPESANLNAGAKVSLSVNSVFSVIQLIGLVILIIASFSVGQAKNIVSEGGFAPFGVKGIFQAAGVVIFALSGFEIICNASEEAVNPRRDVPRALGISLLIIIALYVPATLGLAALVPRSQIVYASPYVDGFGRLGLTGLMWTSAIFTLLACGLTKLASVYALPRAIYALARDGLLPKCFGHITPCNKQPTVSLVLSSSLIILLAIFLKIEVLADFMSIGVIFCYFIVGLDLIIVRYLHEREDVQKTDEGEEAALLDLGMPVRELVLGKWRLSIPQRLQFQKAFKALLSSYTVLILGLSLCIRFAFTGGLAVGFVLVGFLGFATGDDYIPRQIQEAWKFTDCSVSHHITQNPVGKGREITGGSDFCCDQRKWGDTDNGATGFQFRLTVSIGDLRIRQCNEVCA
ncbi:unnamed protein product [Schistocephalus solidus]|uniref:AA_permease domain-containing protein n=1 Tax=Schistocephalus solidus TaxID=70667 RepID=A0A183TJI2_SCHSO|nr:unnamed protein product [Schistocephalus solidus]